MVMTVIPGGGGADAGVGGGYGGAGEGVVQESPVLPQVF